MLSKLSLFNWRQFDIVEIDFHPQLTLIVGPNGSGKTALIRALSLLLGMSQIQWGSTDSVSNNTRVGYIVLKDGRSGGIIRSNFGESNEALRIQPSLLLKGFVSYSNKSINKPRLVSNLIFLPRLIDSFKIYFRDHFFTQQGCCGGLSCMFGCCIPVIGVIIYFCTLASEYWGTLFTSTLLVVAFVSLVTFILLNLKRADAALIEWEILRYESLNGKNAIPIRKFFEISKEILHIDFIFRNRRIHYSWTNSSDKWFYLSSLSDGYVKTLDILWNLCKIDFTEAGDYLALIDELENHLHPGLQRVLLTRMLARFPRAQFVITTHSPFFVGAAEDSAVCLLKVNGKGKIVSQILDKLDLDRGGTANDILREALGISTSRPMWLEEDLLLKLSAYLAEEPSKELVDKLHSELKAAGQAKLLPDAVRIWMREREAKVKEREALEEDLLLKLSAYLAEEPSKELVDKLHSELKAAGQATLLPDAVRIWMREREAKVKEREAKEKEREAKETV